MALDNSLFLALMAAKQQALQRTAMHQSQQFAQAQNQKQFDAERNDRQFAQMMDLAKFQQHRDDTQTQRDLEAIRLRNDMAQATGLEEPLAYDDPRAQAQAELGRLQGEWQRTQAEEARKIRLALEMEKSRRAEFTAEEATRRGLGVADRYTSRFNTEGFIDLQAAQAELARARAHAALNPEPKGSATKVDGDPFTYIKTFEPTNFIDSILRRAAAAVFARGQQIVAQYAGKMSNAEIWDRLRADEEFRNAMAALTRIKREQGGSEEGEQEVPNRGGLSR